MKKKGISSFYSKKLTNQYGENITKKIYIYTEQTSDYC